jgi:hypothetical protein
MTLTHNLIGKNHTYYQFQDPAAIRVRADRNSFVEPASPGGPFGTNSVRWSAGKTAVELGVSADSIEVSIAVLGAAFRQPVETLASEREVVRSWKVLQNALDTWVKRR